MAFLSWRLSARKRQRNKLGLSDARPAGGVIRFDIATSLSTLTVVVRSPEGVSAPLGFAVSVIQLCSCCVLPVDNMYFTLDLCETQVKAFLYFIFEYTETHKTDGVMPMSSANKNTKSQLFTVRVPHEVVSNMESLKHDGESSAGFIVSAMQGEIARRQTEGNEEALLLSSLDALTRVEEIGTRAGEEIQQIISVARDELQRRQRKKSKESE